MCDALFQTEAWAVERCDLLQIYVKDVINFKLIQSVCNECVKTAKSKVTLNIFTQLHSIQPVLAQHKIS